MQLHPVSIQNGNSPLILSQPHTGQKVPGDIAQNLNQTGLSLKDTDWHIDTLYDFTETWNVTVIRANYSRYVIDLNRPIDGISLYPGQTVTELCPTKTFDCEPLYKPGYEPDETEINTRIEHYYKPYHQALCDAIKRVKKQHGYALVYDCHSIRSYIPDLFNGHLPCFSIGTYNNASCPEALTHYIASVCQQAKGYSTSVNGRFKGGYITRHYGKPDDFVFALQMELAQKFYMQEASPWKIEREKASQLKQVLKKVLETFLSQGHSIVKQIKSGE